ncbi:MAG TPA: hypothetical protein VKR06_20235 [Ktedonosporobacter sp.]|nr:hypothetical protein [Ktedonosporobacter sp.]
MVTALLHIRREHGLTSAQLAEAAGVPLRVAYLGEIGGLVGEEDAMMILKALSRLTGNIYTVETVELNMKARNSYEPASSRKSASASVGSERLAEHR